MVYYFCDKYQMQGTYLNYCYLLYDNFYEWPWNFLTDLGHCWTGEVSQHYTGLLQRRPGYVLPCASAPCVNCINLVLSLVLSLYSTNLQYNLSFLQILHNSCVWWVFLIIIIHKLFKSFLFTRQRESFGSSFILILLSERNIAVGSFFFTL